jgi:hypothetical protein
MAATDLFTLSDLALQVANNIGATDDTTLAKIKKHINRALIRFSEMGTWSWQYQYGATLSTVEDQEEYSLEGVLKVNSLYTSGTTQRRLVLIEDRQFRAMYPNNTASGTPYYWRRTGSSTATANTMKLAVYPIPDGVYTLKYDYIKPITLLVDDTDDVRVVTGMPSPLVDLVIEMATAIGWKEIDDSVASNQMQECLLRLKSAYADDQSEIDEQLIMAPMESDDWNRFWDPVLPSNFNGY